MDMDTALWRGGVSARLDNVERRLATVEKLLDRVTILETTIKNSARFGAIIGSALGSAAVLVVQWLLR